MSEQHQVQVRRAYDDPANSDGTRILVDRIWPRGLSKDKAQLDDWLKDLAPSSDLRKWYSHDPDKFEEFSERYREELKDYAKKGKLTLLTASKRDDISDATVLKKVLDGK